MKITKQIGIDMGHRVMQHESKCRNLHGHRYEIIATLEGDLHADGPQAGMVMDFGFIKRAMMSEIDDNFDHALCLEKCDEFLSEKVSDHNRVPLLYGPTNDPTEYIAEVVYLYPTWIFSSGEGSKVVVLDRTPTAENLAYIWFQMLAPHCHGMLESLTVWETPSSSATYTPVR